MNNQDQRLQTILNEIEFPGEQGEHLTEYLEEIDFTENVMTSIRQVSSSKMNGFTWLIFSIFNFFLLLILGSSRFILSDFFNSYPGLSQFFFLFLGLTLFGGLAGLILTRQEHSIPV